MNIKTWSGFSKRRNSTKQPTGGSSVTVALKDGTSIENPVFLLSGDDFTINYVEAFGHYYYVKDIVSIRKGLIELHCSQDVLATYKSDIGSTSAYILYDTTANTEQVDSRLSVVTTPTVQSTLAALRSDISDAGSYIVSLTGEHTVGTYVVTRSALDALMPNISTVFDTFVGGTSSGSTLDDIYQSIRDSIKQMVSSGSVPANIRDVRWIPFTVAGDVLTPLYVGQYQAINQNGVQVSGMRIDNRIDTDTVTLNIPWQFTDWRNSDSNTQLQLYIPFVGLVNYPASAIKNVSTISVDTSLDRVTGDIAIEVYALNEVLGTYGASTGVAIPLGSSGISAANIVNNVLTGAASVAMGNLGGAIGSGISALTPLSQSVGGISSGAGSGLPKWLQFTSICHDTVVSPSSVSSVMGTPANEVKTIGSLSGYVQCSGASVSCNALEKDREEINGYLNGGFFYE